MAFHQDQVIEKPASAKNVGSTPFCQHAALIYDSRILTLQPHPEFDKHFVSGLLEGRGKELPESVQADAARTLHEPISPTLIAHTMKNFLNAIHTLGNEAL